MANPSGRFKLMKDRTLTELEQTITNAEQIGQALGRKCDLMVNPFWEFCAGIDAYFEKRKRKELLDHRLDKQALHGARYNMLRNNLQASLTQLERQKQMELKITISLSSKVNIDSNDYKNDDGTLMTTQEIKDQITEELQEDWESQIQNFDFELSEVKFDAVEEDKT